MPIAWTIPVLTIAAFLTATLSGVIGMGGGILLLAIMFSCLESHGEVIPLHGSVQLVSNSTRAVAFVRDADWPTLGRFALGAVPGACIGAVVLWRLGELEGADPYLKMLIGAYVLVAAYLPTPRRAEHAGRWYDFPLLGLICGAAALTVGAVAPLIAPLFARRQFVKERLIATNALCQILTHLLKIPAFWIIGALEPSQFSILFLCMAAATIPGTLLGKRILRHVSPSLFMILFRVALTVAGLKVFFLDGVLALAGPANGP